MSKKKKYPYETDEKGYVKLNGTNKPYMLLKIYVDRINEDGLHEDSKGNKYIVVNVNQSKFSEGRCYLSQTVPFKSIKNPDAPATNIIGYGEKTIAMDFWIENLCGGDYLEYLFKQEDGE